MPSEQLKCSFFSLGLSRAHKMFVHKYLTIKYPRTKTDAFSDTVGVKHSLTCPQGETNERSYPRVHSASFSVCQKFRCLGRHAVDCVFRKSHKAVSASLLALASWIAMLKSMPVGLWCTCTPSSASVRGTTFLCRTGEIQNSAGHAWLVVHE